MLQGREPRSGRHRRSGPSPEGEVAGVGVFLGTIGGPALSRPAPILPQHVARDDFRHLGGIAGTRSVEPPSPRPTSAHFASLRLRVAFKIHRCTPRPGAVPRPERPIMVPGRPQRRPGYRPHGPNVGPISGGAYDRCEAR
jgi:hypothetical protein